MNTTTRTDRFFVETASGSTYLLLRTTDTTNHGSAYQTRSELMRIYGPRYSGDIREFPEIGVQMRAVYQDGSTIFKTSEVRSIKRTNERAADAFLDDFWGSRAA
jgi:hypothetical protein